MLTSHTTSIQICVLTSRIRLPPKQVTWPEERVNLTGNGDFDSIAIGGFNYVTWSEFYSEQGHVTCDTNYATYTLNLQVSCRYFQILISNEKILQTTEYETIPNYHE